MRKCNLVLLFKRSVIGTTLFVAIFLGGMNTGCSMSSSLADTAISLGVTLLEYAVEALIDTSTTSSTSS
jgi:formate hydrogenlyase subunit 4